MFEKRDEEDQKQSPQIGKLKTEDLFNNSTEDKGVVVSELIQ